MRLLAIIAIAATPAFAADFDFDNAVDVPALVRELKVQTGTEKAPVQAPMIPAAPESGKVKTYLTDVEVIEHVDAKPAFRPQNAICRNDRDCVGFIFEPADTETESVYLRSTEYREECRYDRDGRRDCWCTPSYSYRAKVNIKIVGRKPLYPWEREKFVMCLEDRWLTYDEVAIAYEYDAGFIKGTGTVEARPKHKVAMRPDEEGLSLAAFELEGGNFKVVVTDKWSREYATAGGELTGLRIKLKRDAFLSDPTVAELNLNQPPQDRYEIRLADHASAFKEALKPGSKYYIELSYQRLGKVSTDKTIDRGETGKIEYPKTASPGAAR